jgi:diguanylate cyclase (GGDEF)-like protein
MSFFQSPYITADGYRFYVATQPIFLVGLIFHAAFIPLFYYLDIKELFYFNFLSVIIYTISLILNYRGKQGLALWLAYFEVNVHAVLAVLLIGWESGFYFYLMAIAPLLFLNPKLSLFKKSLTLVIPVFSVIWLHRVMLLDTAVYIFDESIINLLNEINAVATILILAYLSFIYSRAVSISEERLRSTSMALEVMAATDPLTDILNRRAMLDEIKSEVARYRVSGRPFVLALGDVDDFKSINDEYGHLNGDIVLKKIAAMLGKNFRKGDLIGRWGGEEFLILLVGTNVDEAEVAIDKVRQNIEDTQIKLGDHLYSVTITFGLCEFRSGMTIDECLHRADLALYLGKSHGKNQTVKASMHP